MNRAEAELAKLNLTDQRAQWVHETYITDDTELLGNRLRDLRPGGGTSLYDAMIVACRDRMMLDRPMHNFRRAMILISDGEDNASSHTRDQAMEFAQRTDVVLYAISREHFSAKLEKGENRA